MLQARGLSDIAQGCKEIGLSVVVFTGYTLEYLRKNPMPGVLELLEYTDLLIDGPFVLVKPEQKRNWVGSTNQHFHFLSDRYKKEVLFDENYSNGFELRIFQNGTIFTNGQPLSIDFQKITL